jgi:5'-nucleotidase
MKSGLRILVTNDDGINADGLVALEAIARTLSDDVWIVAPELEQSGASHSLTLHMPVRLRKLGDKRFAVSGTPTDCVLVAIQEVLPSFGAPAAKKGAKKAKAKPFDLVLSGINRGSNAGDDVTYSGTIAAAMEGATLGVPSIALSQQCEDRDNPNWEVGKKLAPKLIKTLLSEGWPDNNLININFPDCAPGKVKGIRLCPQGKRRVGVALTGRMDVKNRPYFWIGGDRDNTADRPGVDIDLLYKGYVTVTPLCLDLTDYKTMEGLRPAIRKLQGLK